ncbi:hypothetical protein KA111_02365 [Candidatus Woesebacteria bacterium]|nr:hypothetical protein [Candidatus Woesebacteria bacterium]
MNNEHLQPLKSDKNWLIIFIISSIIIILSSITFNIATTKVVPTQENTYKSATPGFEFTNSIQENLGNPIETKTTDLGIEYRYKSEYPVNPDIILVSPENKVIFMKEKISYNPENNLKPYLQKFGEPQLILFSTQMSNSVRANVFLNQGLVIFTHIKDQSVQEIWRFEPTTQEIFMNTWGKTLSTEENGPEAF